MLHYTGNPWIKWPAFSQGTQRRETQRSYGICRVGCSDVVVQPLAKECLKSPEAGKAKTSLDLVEGAQPIPWFQTLTSRRLMEYFFFPSHKAGDAIRAPPVIQPRPACPPLNDTSCLLVSKGSKLPLHYLQPLHHFQWIVSIMLYCLPIALGYIMWFQGFFSSSEVKNPSAVQEM